MLTQHETVTSWNEGSGEKERGKRLVREEPTAATTAVAAMAGAVARVDGGEE